QAPERSRCRAEAARPPANPRQRTPQREVGDIEALQASELQLVPDDAEGEDRPANPGGDEALDRLGAVDLERAPGLPPAPTESGVHDRASPRPFLPEEEGLLHELGTRDTAGAGQRMPRSHEHPQLVVPPRSYLEASVLDGSLDQAELHL